MLNALRTQTLAVHQWELIIIDNNSTNNVLCDIDIKWHPNLKLIAEDKQGLTYSRIAGFNSASGKIVVMVDDDNVVAPDYLENVRKYFSLNSQIGAIGGKIKQCFIGFEPEEWTKEFWHMLAIRDLGDNEIISIPGSSCYPAHSPVGAGMAIRKHLFKAYQDSINLSSEVITDRSGDNLSSGGDNEINIHVLRQGYSVAYIPDLILEHIIPANRLTKKYLARLNYQSSKSWIKLILKYDICPWRRILRKTVLIRKIKAWVTQKAWESATNHIRWRGLCGVFEALAE